MTGFTVIELFFCLLIVGVIGGLFLTFFKKISTQHQSAADIEVAQSSFIKLCEELNKDLSGCKSFTITPSGSGFYSLAIQRSDCQIAYEFDPTAGSAKRTLQNDVWQYKFFHGKPVPTDFSLQEGGSNPNKTVTFSIRVHFEPLIEINRLFKVRLTTSDGGFFQTPTIQ
ncbi:MAG: hypothetical protein HQM08_20290 [Candidatus Riflebacteria bacterium]|nr:hypothetical protein [Candidatus Riflebacteria bacterium]